MAWPQFPTWQRPKGMLKCLAAREQSVVMWIRDEFVGFASASSCSLSTSPTWHYQITVAYRADCIKASCQADYVAHLGWGSMSLSISLKKQAGKLEMSVLDCEIPTTYLIKTISTIYSLCGFFYYVLHTFGKGLPNQYRFSNSWITSILITLLQPNLQNIFMHW